MQLSSFIHSSMAGTNSESLVKNESETGVKVTAGALTKKGKRPVQFGDETRPKKVAHKEQTAEGMLQKSKDLRKHRQSLPIYTGTLNWKAIDYSFCVMYLVIIVFNILYVAALDSFNSAGYDHQGSQR
jgi:hypothetical protein